MCTKRYQLLPCQKMHLQKKQRSYLETLHKLPEESHTSIISSFLPEASSGIKTWQAPARNAKENQKPLYLRLQELYPEPRRPSLARWDNPSTLRHRGQLACTLHTPRGLFFFPRWGTLENSLSGPRLLAPIPPEIFSSTAEKYLPV